MHVPLVLLPLTAYMETVAALHPRDRRLEEWGRRLWWGTAGGGLLTALAGLAASQEIELRGGRAKDRMFLHGFGNLGIVFSAVVVAAWRGNHRASFTSAAWGIVASTVVLYTSYLGGDLVYTHGAGVRSHGGQPARNPALFSKEAPGRLARDVGRGFAFIARRAIRAVSGRQRVDRHALGPIAEVGTGSDKAVH